jgi:hypothetical protein
MMMVLMLMMLQLMLVVVVQEKEVVHAAIVKVELGRRGASAEKSK